MRKGILVISPDKEKNEKIFEHYFSDDVFHDNILNDYCMIHGLKINNIIDLCKNNYCIIYKIGSIYEFFMPEEINDIQHEDLINLISRLFNSIVNINVDISVINYIGKMKIINKSINDESIVIECINKIPVIKGGKKNVRKKI